MILIPINTSYYYKLVNIIIIKYNSEYKFKN